MFTHRRSDFPDGFVFGTATASHQIEGAIDSRGPCIWDSFAQTPGNVENGDTGAVADDHFNRWPEDLDLMIDAGFDAYRFSVAWPRLIPDGDGAVSQPGIDFYDRLIDGMLERGLKPFCTLYHWDLPSALQDKGGWTNRDIAGWFADYAALVQKTYGDRLATVATINEPWCVAFLGHFVGEHAPGHRDIRDTARAMHHVMLAHGTAVAALRAGGASDIGIVTNLQKCEPASDSDEDAAATHSFDGIFNRWYLDGLFKGAYPADVVERFAPHLPDGFEGDGGIVAAPLDWHGINYYTRSLVAADPANPDGFTVVEGPLETTEMGWEIYPQGLTDLLVRVAANYHQLPLYITENGMAEVPGTDDARRIAYFEDHLAACRKAIAQGVDVRGYFAWSLIDNFEWARGYAKRFGLVEVDYETQRRTPRRSFLAFKAALRGN